MITKISLEKYISRIKKFLLIEDYDSALLELENAIIQYPDTYVLYTNAGNIYTLRSEYKKAEDYYLKSLTLKKSKEALNNLAHMYVIQGLYDEALKYTSEALEIDSLYVDALFNQALIYERKKELPSAKIQLDKIINLQPNHAKALILAFKIAQETCEWDKVEILNQKLDLMIGNGEEHPFINISRVIDNEKNFKTATSWAKKNNIVLKKNTTNSSIHKKIRIGYMCGEFRNHPTYYLIKNLFEYHNHDKFEVHIFSYNHDNIIKDELEKKIYKFHDINDLSEIDAIDLIQSCEIDILIDLSILITNNHINIIKSRPAKKIVSYLGFPGTSGYECYDYMITDEIVTPKEYQKFYTEKFLYLPNCYQINDGIKNTNNLNVKKSDYTLPESSLVLASFNQTYKIDKIMFDCWLSIIKNVPNSVLWLLIEDEMTKNNIHNYMQKSDVNKNRLICANKVSRKEHMERLKLVDLVLDTRIYNGHTTTTDALQTSIPVITLKGNHFASRVSTSLLHNAELDELCCESMNQYKNMAIEILTNKKTQDKFIQKLKLMNENHKFFNNKLFVRSLEKNLLII
ncbi:MAG: hypothetical protein CMD88_03475 [Gammaproteobacteria bacterium]|nr:hypothetical protein [Gammaproteobacteria bacterium]